LFLKSKKKNDSAQKTSKLTAVIFTAYCKNALNSNCIVLIFLPENSRNSKKNFYKCKNLTLKCKWQHAAIRKNNNTANAMFKK